jgi:delta14-sterol reductase
MLYFLCNNEFCVDASTDWTKFQIPSIESLWSQEAATIYLVWMAANVVLERLLPGETVEGADLPTTPPTKLKYTMSGHLQFWILIIAMGHAVPLIIQTPSATGAITYSLRGFMPLRLDLIYDHYLPLISVSIVFSSILSVYLYVSSFMPKGKILAKGGNTGNMVYDFFIGRELNPRIGSLDLKEFCELRPGLVGWLVINLGMATKQYLNRKALTGVGSISLSMLSITFFQGVYVWDALYNEKAILTTMDITTDGFGYMLAFGDLSWVPFIYSLQARYLVDFDPELTPLQIAAILVLQLFGYYIFRSANSEKDAFRRDPESPDVQHLQFLVTKRGTRLLTSGWWGMARKINYTGDWIITLSWCLLCGWKSPIPYFQAVYFMVLLIHRADRDDQMCSEKYGEDWAEYKRRVPYMFIPYVI